MFIQSILIFSVSTWSANCMKASAVLFSNLCTSVKRSSVWSQSSALSGHPRLCNKSLQNKSNDNYLLIPRSICGSGIRLIADLKSHRFCLIVSCAGAGDVTTLDSLGIFLSYVVSGPLSMVSCHLTGWASLKHGCLGQGGLLI